MPSLLIATSRYTYKHPLYSRNRAMIEFLQRRRGLDFSKVTLLYPDQQVKGSSPQIRTLAGGLEEIRFSLHPLRGDHPALEPTYAVVRIVPYLRKAGAHYDFCVAADLTGWHIAFALRKLGFVSTLVYDDSEYFPRVIRSPQGRLTSAGLEKLIAKTADMIISASETLAELRRRQGARLVRVIPNGVDPSFLLLRGGDVDQRLERKRIVYAGYLDRDYGVGILVEAFSRVMDATGASLILAGTGPLTKDLRVRTGNSEFGSRVELLGPVDHSALGQVMVDATVGVAPYLTGSSAEYGVPLKVKEYMAVGLPVVATNVGEIPQLLDGNNVGIVVKPHVAELAEALIRILSLTPNEYERMSQAARKLAGGYSWDDLYAEYFRILSDLS